MSDIPEVFDCQEFHELCMDYRGATIPPYAQAAYERLQAYCSNALEDAVRERDDARERCFDAHCSYCGFVVEDCGSLEEAMRTAREHVRNCVANPLVASVGTLERAMKQAAEDLRRHLQPGEYHSVADRLDRAISRPELCTETAPVQEACTPTESVHKLFREPK